MADDVTVTVKFDVENKKFLGQLSEVNTALTSVSTQANNVGTFIKNSKIEYENLGKSGLKALSDLADGDGAYETLKKHGPEIAKSFSKVGGIIGKAARFIGGPYAQGLFLAGDGIGFLYGKFQQLRDEGHLFNEEMTKVLNTFNEINGFKVDFPKTDKEKLKSQRDEFDQQSENLKEIAKSAKESNEIVNSIPKYIGGPKDSIFLAAGNLGRDAAAFEAETNAGALDQAVNAFDFNALVEELEVSRDPIKNAARKIQELNREFERTIYELRQEAGEEGFTEEAVTEQVNALLDDLEASKAKVLAERDKALQDAAQLDSPAPGSSGLELFEEGRKKFEETFAAECEAADTQLDAANENLKAGEAGQSAAETNSQAAQANEMAAANALMAAESFSGAIETLASGILPGETAGVPDGVSLGGVELPFGDLIQQLKDIFQKIPEDIKGAIEGVTGNITGIFNQVKDAVTAVPEKFKTAFDQIKEVFTSIPERFQEVFGSIRETVTSIPGKFQEAFGSLQDIFTSIPGTFRDAFGQVRDAFSGIFGSGEGGLVDGVKKAFGSIFGGGEGSLFGGVKDAFKGLFSGGSGIFGGLVDGVKGIFGDIGGSFSGVFDGFKGLFKGFGDNFKGIFGGLTDSFNGLFKRDGALGNIFGNLTKNFKGLFSEDGLLGGLSKGLSGFTGQFSGLQNVVGKLGGGIQKLFGSEGGLGSLFGEGGLTSLFGEGGLLGGLGGKLSGAIGNLGSSLSGAFSGAFSGAGIGSLLGVFGSKGQTGAQIGGALGSTIGSFVPVVGNVVGGLIGSTLGKIFGGLFGKKKRGTVTLNTDSGGDLFFTREYGKGKGRIEQARELGNGVFDELKNIADALGGSIRGGLNLGSIGTRKKDFVFDPTGRGRTKGSGVQRFKSAEEAVFAALRRALGKGAVAGISEHVQRALTSTSDINAALKKALDVQEFERYLEGLKPVMRNVFLEFERQAKERLDMARKFGFGLAQIEEYNAKERAEILEAELSRAVGSLKDLLKDLTYGDLAGGTPQERLDHLRVEQEEAAQRVRNGEEGAAEEFAAITREILAISEQLYGSAGQYGQDLGLSRTEVEQLIAQAEADVNAQLQEAREQAGTLPEQQLSEANASLDDIALSNARILAALQQGVAYGGGGGGSINFSLAQR